MKPPEVVVDGQGAKVQFAGVVQWRIDWSEVHEIAVEVLVNADLEYSEAFWKLSGGTGEFWSPVDLIMGADVFTDWLFEFFGFDIEEFQQARGAEGDGKPEVFVCWRKTNV